MLGGSETYLGTDQGPKMILWKPKITEKLLSIQNRGILLNEKIAHLGVIILLPFSISSSNFQFPFVFQFSNSIVDFNFQFSIAELQFPIIHFQVPILNFDFQFWTWIFNFQFSILIFYFDMQFSLLIFNSIFIFISK